MLVGGILGLALDWVAAVVSVPALGGFAASSPAEASSGTLELAVVAGAGLVAALLTGGFTWLVGREGRRAVARAAGEAQLREAREHAADDIRTVGDLGASLDKAVTKLLASEGAKERRSEVSVASSDLEARLEFIWDEELRNRMGEFVRLARDSAGAYSAADFRTCGNSAINEWKGALERAGVVWRTLMRAALLAGDILPPNAVATPAASVSSAVASPAVAVAAFARPAESLPGSDVEVLGEP